MYIIKLQKNVLKPRTFENVFKMKNTVLKHFQQFSGKRVFGREKLIFLKHSLAKPQSVHFNMEKYL